MTLGFFDNESLFSEFVQHKSYVLVMFFLQL